MWRNLKVDPISYLLPLTLLIYIQFFHQLGGLGLVGPDEPRYAKVAKEMLDSGDYITPRLSGQPWFEKPILYYWLTVLAYRVLGISEFSARLPSALAGTLGVLAVFFLGVYRKNGRLGFLSAAILSTCVLYFSLARAASVDMLLTATLAVAWSSVLVVLVPEIGRETKEKPPPLSRVPPVHLWLFYSSLALSVLAKGPVGLVLVLSSVFLFLTVTRQLHLLRRMRFAFGLVLFSIITLPWYWLCYRANGYVFVEEFLVKHNLERFSTERFQHLQPFWFYLAVLFVGFLPWIFQIGSAARRFLGSRSERISPERSLNLYLWLWVIIPLIFFSSSKSKLPAYLLPVAPAIALLTAIEFERFLGSRSDGREGKWFKGCVWCQSLFTILLGAFLPFIAGRLNVEISRFVPQLSSGLLALGLVGMVFLSRQQVRAFFASYLIGVALIVVFITYRIFPEVDHLESSRKLAAQLKQLGFVDQPVFIYGLSRRVEYGLNFYLDTRTRIVYSENDLQPASGKPSFLITPLSFDRNSVLVGSGIERETVFQHQRIFTVIPRANDFPSRGGAS